MSLALCGGLAHLKSGRIGMSYGILRIEKIKHSDGGGLLNRLKHTYREFGKTSERSRKAFDKYKTLTDGIKCRSDSVGVIEVVLTSSKVKGWKSNDYRSYLRDALEWSENKFGSENYVGGELHVDEKVPHLHIFFACVQEKEIKKKQTADEREKGTFRTEKVRQLNAKQWLNGKESLHFLQEDYFEKVSSKHGFERGESAEITKRKNIRPTLNFQKQKQIKTEEKQRREDKRLEIIRTAQHRFYSAFWKVSQSQDKKAFDKTVLGEGLTPEEKQICVNAAIYKAEQIRSEKREKEALQNVENTLSSGRTGKGSR